MADQSSAPDARELLQRWLDAYAENYVTYLTEDTRAYLAAPAPRPVPRDRVLVCDACGAQTHLHPHEFAPRQTVAIPSELGKGYQYVYTPAREPEAVPGELAGLRQSAQEAREEHERGRTATGDVTAASLCGRLARELDAAADRIEADAARIRELAERVRVLECLDKERQAQVTEPSGAAPAARCAAG